MSDLVTVGWLTMDDIVLPDGTCQKHVLGGGALYSAIGAQIWNDSVGIHSVTGRPYINCVRDGIESRGLDAGGIGAIPGNGLELWILHESENGKQQIPKLTSSSALDMDSGRGPLPEGYALSTRGYHIAPQGSPSTIASIRALSGLPSRPVITLDVLSDAYVDPRFYQDLGFLRGVTAFLPSDSEISRLWAPAGIEDWVAEQARAFNCHVAAKLGDKGSLLCEAAGNCLYHVPVSPVAVVDTTGAGDAYCGGFLAGLVDGRPAPECAAMGTVSASYVIEARGALATAKPGREERDARLAAVMSRITRRGVA